MFKRLGFWGKKIQEISTMLGLHPQFSNLSSHHAFSTKCVVWRKEDAKQRKTERKNKIKTRWYWWLFSYPLIKELTPEMEVSCQVANCMVLQIILRIIVLVHCGMGYKSAKSFIHVHKFMCQSDSTATS